MTVVPARLPGQVESTDPELDWLRQERERLLVEHRRLTQELAAQRARVAEEEIRRKLARDLHDGPAQDLATLALHLDYVRRLAGQDAGRLSQEIDAAREQAVKISRAVRDLLFELRPLVLEAGGLVSALEALVARTSSRPGPSGSLTVRGTPVPLPDNVEPAVFAVVQEAVGNVRKHAAAERFSIELDWLPGALRVCVHDDGVGFDTVAVGRDYATRESYGLLNMRERADLLGARLEVMSAVGAGTVVTLDVPLDVDSPVRTFSSLPGDLNLRHDAVDQRDSLARDAKVNKAATP